MTDEPQLFPATYRAPITKQVKTLLTVLGLALLAFFGRAHLTLSSPFSIWIFALVCLGFLFFITLNEVYVVSYFITIILKNEHGWVSRHGSERMLLEYGHADMEASGSLIGTTADDTQRTLSFSQAKALACSF